MSNGMTSPSRSRLRRCLGAASLSGTLLGVVFTSPGAIAATKKKTTTTVAKRTKSSKATTAGSLWVGGPPIETGRWGPVQVAIRVGGRKIIGVSTPVHPNHTSRSVAINDRALPVYRTEVLTAQSAYIDIVSGATDTWSAYALSLQGAIDSAKGKHLL